MQHRWVCLTHQMDFPHNVTRRMPDGRNLTDEQREQACRTVPALVVAASILEA